MRFREFVSLFYLYKMMFSVMIYKIWDQNLSKIFMTGGFLMKVTDRIAVLRGEMELEGIDIWICPPRIIIKVNMWEAISRRASI